MKLSTLDTIAAFVAGGVLIIAITMILIWMGFHMYFDIVQGFCKLGTC